MSRCRRKDYKCVFRALIAMLPRRQRVQAVASDFEAAVWLAAREVLLGVLQRGCAFHFSPAVWRNIQAVGLQCAYTSDERVNHVSSNDGIATSTCRRHCRRVSDLAYYVRRPAGCTASAVHGAPVDQLHHLAAYTTWSVFRQPVQTNNDVEGWHCRLNDKASRPARRIQVDSVAVRAIATR